MKRIRPGKLLLSVLLLLSMTLSLFACGEAKPEETETEKPDETTADATETETEAETEAPPREIAPVYPENGTTVSLLTEEMTNWVKKYKAGKLDKIFDFTEKCEPVPVVFQWENADDALYSHIFIADNEKMENAAVYLCSTPYLTVEDLYTGTDYFWQVVAEYGDKTEKSGIFSFKTMYSPRTLAVDGVSNVRDIGGYTVSDGRQIKRGIVYRGGDFERITEAGKNKLVNVIGIKTELDLREKTNKGPSPLGADINYCAVSAPWYNNALEDAYRGELVKELRVFADPDNYPIYFHCSLGRDRTGTLSFLLLALCGATRNDIYMDYEVSFFSDYSGYVDKTLPSVMTNTQLDAFRRTVQSYDKKGTLAEATRAFLISLGMTDEELDAIRANLLTDAR